MTVVGIETPAAVGCEDVKSVFGTVLKSDMHRWGAVRHLHSQ